MKWVLVATCPPVTEQVVAAPLSTVHELPDALLVALSLFLGLAFEDFFASADSRRPGGIRTFPMLALAGGVLYLFDPVHFIPFTAGLLVVGAWLTIFYRQHFGEPDDTGEPSAAIHTGDLSRGKAAARGSA